MASIDKIATITIAVADQDEALRWFTEKLDFEVRLDIATPGLRWLTVAPRKQTEVEFLLASWFPERVGKNATWVAATEDCRGAFGELEARGVEFLGPPQERPYGIEAVFRDLCGNHYALVQRR